MRNQPPVTPSLPVSRRFGFTLVELLVVLTVLGSLAALLLPALAGAKTRAGAIQCLNNLRQLQLGWLQYVEDNNDSIPPTISRKTGTDQMNVAVNGRVPWVLGNAKLDSNPTNIESGVLFPYAGSTSAYRCPADRSTVPSRPSTLRLRSYSTHNWLNCDVISGSALEAVNDSPFNIRKASRLLNPGPSQTLVFLEEDPVSIDDGIFVIGSHWAFPDGDREWWWISYPADRHGNAGSVSYADGRAETPRWRARRVAKPYNGGKIFFNPADTENKEDADWLHNRIPRSP